MLTKYIQAAMKRAQYEILEDKSYYGSIPLNHELPVVDGIELKNTEVA